MRRQNIFLESLIFSFLHFSKVGSRTLKVPHPLSLTHIHNLEDSRKSLQKDIFFLSTHRPTELPFLAFFGLPIHKFFPLGRNCIHPSFHRVPFVRLDGSDWTPERGFGLHHVRTRMSGQRSMRILEVDAKKDKSGSGRNASVFSFLPSIASHLGGSFVRSTEWG